MHTIILAFVIALAGLVVIAGGALELSTLEAAEGEMLQVSDYLSGIGTIASGHSASESRLVVAIHSSPIWGVTYGHGERVRRMVH
jgi:hypothetical protein